MHVFPVKCRLTSRKGIGKRLDVDRPLWEIVTALGNPSKQCYSVDFLETVTTTVVRIPFHPKNLPVPAKTDLGDKRPGNNMGVLRIRCECCTFYRSKNVCIVLTTAWAISLEVISDPVTVIFNRIINNEMIRKNPGFGVQWILLFLPLESAQSHLLLSIIAILLRRWLVFLLSLFSIFRNPVHLVIYLF